MLGLDKVTAQITWEKRIAYNIKCGYVANEKGGSGEGEEYNNATYPPKYAHQNKRKQMES